MGAVSPTLSMTLIKPQRLMYIPSLIDGKRPTLTVKQLKSNLSRVRSLAVHQCKKLLPVHYGFDKLTKQEIATKVEWLLEDDRFLSPSDYREVNMLKYGNRLKSD